MPRRRRSENLAAIDDPGFPGRRSVALAFKDSGNESGFFWYATALIAVSLVVYLWLPDTRKNSPLDQPA